MESVVVHNHIVSDGEKEVKVPDAVDTVPCNEGTAVAGEMTEQMDVDYVWKRTQRRNLQGQDDMMARFEVISAKILPGPEGSNTNKPYVLYRIHVRMQGIDQATDQFAAIDRRYTELLNLYDELRKDYSTLLQDIVFPKKRLIGNFSDSLIAERSAAFETFLDFISMAPALRDSPAFLEFIQGDELKRACHSIDERRHEQAIPILENCFRVLNKIFLDKSKQVLLILCRLVAACIFCHAIPHPNAEKWIVLALRRFEHVSDVEILVLYIPLLQACVKYYNSKNEDCQNLEDRLKEMGKRGIKITGTLSLQQAIHAMDPRSETA